MELLHLLILQQRVHSEIDFPPEEMSVADALQKLLCGKILGVGPGPELVSSQIDGIRARMDSPVEPGRVPGGRKQFDSVILFHKKLPCISSLWQPIMKEAVRDSDSPLLLFL